MYQQLKIDRALATRYNIILCTHIPNIPRYCGETGTTVSLYLVWLLFWLLSIPTWGCQTFFDNIVRHITQNSGETRQSISTKTHAIFSCNYFRRIRVSNVIWYDLPVSEYLLQIFSLYKVSCLTCFQSTSQYIMPQDAVLHKTVCPSETVECI